MAALLPLAAAAACPRAAPEVARELASAFNAHSLDPAEAARILGSGSQSRWADGAWLVQGPPGCGLQVVLPVKSDRDEQPRAELRIAADEKLQLADLTALWGSSEVVHKSKTSSVMFRLRAPGAEPTFAFALLSDSKALPASQVQRLRLRRLP
jgi:hypothetical protein